MRVLKILGGDLVVIVTIENLLTTGVNKSDHVFLDKLSRGWSNSHVYGGEGEEYRAVYRGRNWTFWRRWRDPGHQVFIFSSRVLR